MFCKKILTLSLASILFFSFFTLLPSGKTIAVERLNAYYVDPLYGNDENDGEAANTAFKTVEKAKTAVREIRNTLTDDFYVYLKGGIYSFNSGLEFTTEDSGINGYNIIYENYNETPPVFSGGDVLTPVWENDIGSIVKSNIGVGKDFRQIYINGNKEIRARHPNQGSYAVMTVAPNLTLSSDQQNSGGLYIPNGMLPPVIKTDEIEVSLLIEWMNKKFRINSVKDAGVNSLAVINNIEWDAMINGAQALRDFGKNRQYFLENAYEFIDSEGEWYYNKETGYLYYYPHENENIQQCELIIPVLDNIININGTLKNNVENIIFNGISFEYTNWTRPTHMGFVDVQANTLIPSSQQRLNGDAQYRHGYAKDRITPAIQVNSGSNIRITNCNFNNLGGSGIAFCLGGENNFIDNNTLGNICGNGIEIGNTAQFPNSEKMIPKNYIISNNRLNNIAMEYVGGIGILTFYTDTVLIMNNDINNTPYSAISSGWGWGNELNAETKNTIISNNKIQNANTLLPDGGAIYTLNSQINSVVSGNYIKNKNTVGQGLYHDEASGGFITENNVLEGSFDNAIHVWVTTIHDILIRNNFINKGTVLNEGKNVSILNLYQDNSDNPVWPEKAMDIILEAGYKKGLPLPQIPETKTQSVILMYPDPRVAEPNGGENAPSEVVGYNNSIVRKSYFDVTYKPNLSAGMYKVSVYKPDFGNWYNTNFINHIDSSYSIRIYLNNRSYNPHVFPVGGSSYIQKTINYRTNYMDGGWYNVGVYYFDGTDNNYIHTFRTNSSYNYSSAVRFERVSYTDPSFPKYPVLPTPPVIKPDSLNILIEDSTENAYMTGYQENGAWSMGGYRKGYTQTAAYSNSYISRKGAAGTSVTYTPDIKEDGLYNVYVYKTHYADSPSPFGHLTGDANAKLEIFNSESTDTQYLNYKAGYDGWYLLGTYEFEQGTGGYLKATHSGDANTYLYADAVYFEKAAAVTSIEITNPPDKTDYYAGNSFDTTGMVVTAYFDDSTVKVIGNYTVTPQALSVDDNNIMVEYRGETAQVTVNVSESIIYLKGDVNGDGIIEILDSIILRQYMLGGYDIIVNNISLINSDTDNNGKINITDALILRLYILGGYGVSLE